MLIVTVDTENEKLMLALFEHLPVMHAFRGKWTELLRWLQEKEPPPMSMRGLPAIVHSFGTQACYIEDDGPMRVSLYGNFQGASWHLILVDKLHDEPLFAHLVRTIAHHEPDHYIGVTLDHRAKAEPHAIRTLLDQVETGMGVLC